MSIVILTLLGLCLGSYVNALVWRIHEQDQVLLKKRASAKLIADLSIMKGRSMCPACHHTLNWYDLIPVLSWLQLRGKCRYCHKSISSQYPIVELITAGLFVLSGTVVLWPLTGATILILSLWLMVLTGLVALFVYDLRWMLIPNRILFPLFIPAFLYACLTISQKSNMLTASLQTVAAIIFLGGLFWVLFQVSKGKWIGGGDVRLGFLLGLVVGSFSHSILTLFVASLLGTSIALPLLMMHKAKATTKLPFGPFLITATILVVLYGSRIITWYNHLIIVSN